MNKPIKNTLKSIHLTILEAGKVLNDFFNSDTEVMSKDIKKIMSNPEDKKKYLNAIKQLKVENKKSAEVTFSNKEKMILTLEE
ncbi:MAG: hypothetical protein WD607_06275 [Candidatus Paceibacterota bacterium]